MWIKGRVLEAFISEAGGGLGGVKPHSGREGPLWVSGRLAA